MATSATLAFDDAADDTLILRLGGDWSVDTTLPSSREIDERLASQPGIRRVTFDLRGTQCGRSSAAVGAATTSAVVTGIVLIVVSDAVTTVVFDLIGL